jgi:hypothetical protein
MLGWFWLDRITAPITHPFLRWATYRAKKRLDDVLGIYGSGKERDAARIEFWEQAVGVRDDEPA